MSIGLKVSAKQKAYPFELSTNELIAHKHQIETYKEELSTNLYELALNYKPSLNLINQQPEIKQYLRAPILEFLLKISIKTKVTNGIFYQSVRIFDRYCSKRIVLRDQVQLVLATCLWLSAKVYGGCNHIINNTNVPTGGRFNGPTPRARIPRLSELVQLCGGGGGNHNGNGAVVYDEGMFIQMERHILDTLNWDVSEPQLNNWLLNFYENNYLQLESNNHQLDDEYSFDEKIEIIYLKRFLSEVSLFELKSIELHPATLSQIILNILSKYYPDFEFTSELIIPPNIPSVSPSTLSYYENLILDKVLNLSDFTLSYYTQLPGVQQFYETLITTIIKNDSFHDSSSNLGSPASTSSSCNISMSSNSSYNNHSSPYHMYTKHQFNSPINTPQRSPINTKKPTFIPTPPASRRGSPSGTILEIKKYTNGSFTPPLTPLE